jgi:hypothetical protein
MGGRMNWDRVRKDSLSLQHGSETPDIEDVPSLDLLIRLQPTISCTPQVVRRSSPGAIVLMSNELNRFRINSCLTKDWLKVSIEFPLRLGLDASEWRPFAPTASSMESLPQPNARIGDRRGVRRQYSLLCLGGCPGQSLPSACSQSPEPPSRNPVSWTETSPVWVPAFSRPASSNTQPWLCCNRHSQPRI